MYCGVVCSMNEDVFLNCNNEGFWVVVDGMGGYEVGEVVSVMIVNLMMSLDLKLSLVDIVDLLEDVLFEVYYNICIYFCIYCEGWIMGSMVVLLFIW